MKIALQYVNDAEGNVQSVQLPIDEWEKIVEKLEKYEQAIKFRSDLKEAFQEVSALKKQKSKKQTLTEFLDEL